jgi:hypothetical protein
MSVDKVMKSRRCQRRLTDIGGECFIHMIIHSV